MINNNKGKLLLSSAVILLPALVGLFLWNELPPQVATHWGADGSADGWSTKAFAVIGLPLILLALHWFCVFVTAKDPKNKGQNQKVFGMVLWITPFLSLFACGVIYAAAFGKEFHIGAVTLLPIGLMLVVIGNYLPKCKQNHTIGIKVKWALENEENWNATHRLGGRLWVIGGLLLMACIFLPETVFPWAFLLFLPVVVTPIIYSYVYHKKQLKAGTAVITPVAKSKYRRILTIVGLVIVAAVLILIGVVLFTGTISLEYGETAFTIKASYWEDLTVEYAAIDAIEYREQDDPGTRTYGYGSPRLLIGTFQNEELGQYTRYSYTACDACVVLTVDGKTLVISGVNAESTRAIYDELTARQ